MPPFVQTARRSERECGENGARTGTHSDRTRDNSGAGAAYRNRRYRPPNCISRHDFYQVL